MICKNCGTEINEGLRFCPKCGAMQTENQQTQQAYAQPVNQQAQQPYAQPEYQQVQQPYTQPNINANVKSLRPQSAFDKYILITSGIVAGLNLLLMILWFVPVFKLQMDSFSESAMRSLGFPGASIAMADTTQGAEIINVINIVISLIAIVLILLPIFRKDTAKVRRYIYQKVVAVWYGFWMIMELIYFNSQSPEFHGIIKGCSPTFGGILYILSFVGIIVVTIMMKKKTKLNANTFH